jgi:hypothetical protein
MLIQKNTFFFGNIFTKGDKNFSGRNQLEQQLLLAASTVFVTSAITSLL